MSKEREAAWPDYQGKRGLSCQLTNHLISDEVVPLYAQYPSQAPLVRCINTLYIQCSAVKMQWGIVIIINTINRKRLVHFRTSVTLQRVRVRVGLELRLGLGWLRCKNRLYTPTKITQNINTGMSGPLQEQLNMCIRITLKHLREHCYPMSTMTASVSETTMTASVSQSPTQQSSHYSALCSTAGFVCMVW